tara:strand:- start:171 stop:1436 length:1266 start_codon:yes stop_codon:yes gene_type:complete
MHIKRVSIIKLMGLILCFIPFTLLTGPFLPDLSITILCISFLIISIREKLWFYFYNIFFIFFILFCIYLIISSLLSEYRLDSLKSSLFYCRFGIFALSVWFIINNTEDILKKFSKYLLIFFSIAIFDGYFQYFFDYNLFGFSSSSANRMTLLLNDRLILGGYLSRLFPLIIAMLVYNYTSNRKYLAYSFILLVLVDVLIFISGERTALGLLFLSTFATLVMFNNFKILRLAAIVFSVSIIIGISYYDRPTYQRSINYALEQMQIKKDFSSPMYFSADHQSLAVTAYRIFLDNKVIGVGPKLFRKYCNNKEYKAHEVYLSCSTHPHNSFIQVATESGLIGLLFLIIPTVFLFYKMVQHTILMYMRKNPIFSDYQISLLCCFFLTLWPILPTQSFFNNWINIIYFLPVGFFLHSIYSEKAKLV